jgi:hypothetical protein
LDRHTQIQKTVHFWLIRWFFRRGPHTTDSSTSTTPDEDLHTTVKFSNQEDRDNCRGYTVHIYNDSNWKYDPTKYCSWGERTPDQHQDQRVYCLRAEYPETKYISLPANKSTQPGASAPYSSGSDNQGTTYSSAPTSSSYLSVPGSQGVTYSSAPYSYASVPGSQGVTYSSASTSTSYSASNSQDMTNSLKIVVEEPPAAGYWFRTNSNVEGFCYQWWDGAKATDHFK